MRETIRAINGLKKESLIEDYAIGGGIAAIFYIEPFLTYDLDVFVIPTQKEKEGSVILLTPIFDYFRNMGYSFKGEHIVIEGVPVQFIPADELEEEAVRNGKQIEYEGVETKVLPPEYLVAILLRAGRKKDIAKVESLLQQAKVNRKRLKDILRRYGLSDKLNNL